MDIYQILFVRKSPSPIDNKWVNEECIICFQSKTKKNALEQFYEFWNQNYYSKPHKIKVEMNNDIDLVPGEIYLIR